tara:strand:- start:8396 stop:8638 length:243 start_codon:yes stop_codon:yes gene_type:complete
MSQPLQIILGVVALIGAIGSFLLWHFNTLNKLKEQFQELKLEMKDLESRDNLQQQTIDQLENLYPVLKHAMEIINKKKNG